MKKVWDYLWPVLLCVGVGVTAGFFQRSAIEEWYPLLHKPSITASGDCFSYCMEHPLRFDGAVSLFSYKEEIGKMVDCRMGCAIIF